jgi:hypothetical protein
MSQLRTINATKARNNFFELLKESYLQDQAFLVEKGGIPMVKILPVRNHTERKGVINKRKIPRKEYINMLLNLDTSWFTKKVVVDYKQVRHELEDHFNRNSL